MIGTKLSNVLPQLILASRSRARQKMLADAGVTFDACPALIDERSVELDICSRLPKRIKIRQKLEALTIGIASAKAVSVSQQFPDQWVLGSDQMLGAGAGILHKPATSALAVEQLLSLSGRTHELCASVILARNGVCEWQDVGHVELSMRSFSRKFAKSIVNQMGEAATQSVGGYQIENSGIQLFSSITGDYFTILGMPLLPLLGQLREVGILER